MVHLSVCPSVKRVDYDKTEESSVQIFIPYERLYSSVDLQISDEQIIHSHSPLSMLPSLRRRHCLIIGQGQGVGIVQQEYPLTCIVLFCQFCSSGTLYK